MLKLYPLLKENRHKLSVCGFDFDGVLHLNMTPDGHTDMQQIYKLGYVPFKEMHSLFKKERKNFDIVVLVTARNKRSIPEIKQFCKMYGLDFDEYYATNLKSKKQLLLRLGVDRFYDDNSELGDELKDTNIEFILVKPLQKTLEKR